MKKSSLNDQVEFFKPPVAKARPPIKRTNVTENMELPNFKRLNQELSYVINNDDSHDYSHNYSHDYTDDEDYSNDDYEDNKEDSYQFISAHNSPLETKMRTQSFRSTPNNSRYSNVTNHSFVTSDVQSQPTKGSSTKCCNMFLCITVIVLVLCIVLSTLSNNTVVEEKKLDLVETNNLIIKSMRVIQSRFKSQNVYIWNDISAGIYDVALFPTKPTIIILFGKEKGTLNCLAQLLGQLSGNILGSNDYLMLTPNDFPHDVGHVIHNLKEQIFEKKAVIVQDLLDINAEAMRAFHNFCDRENPLVEHAIYIITIIVDGYKSSQKELQFVEKQIFNKLSKHIEKDILDPLITRLTSGIIVPVLPESNTNFSYNDCSLSVNNKL